MEFLLEIGTEELPAGQVDEAVSFLAEQLVRRVREQRLEVGAAQVFATPRRLAVRLTGVGESTSQVEETRMGPSVKAAYDQAGKPTVAALGFARGQGVDPLHLIRMMTGKGEYVAARVVHPGRPAADVLASAISAALDAIPWRKPMRWGWESTAFARPIHWIVAVLQDTVVDFEYAGVCSGRKTWGHRFLANWPFELARPSDYEAVMAEAHVVADISARRKRIAVAAAEAVVPDRLVADEALLDEVVHLVEYPVIGVGRFDERFLELPREVLISEMREHQRYFAVERIDGELTNRFVVVYNTPVRDPDVVIRGNERVLAARLTDGRFFLQRDRRRSLGSRVDDLKEVVFLTQLGTVRQKVDRIVMLSTYLSAIVLSDAARHAKRAALLCKADLTTDMVGEFPELQGTMGRIYALYDGEPEEVAAAIEEHYRPKGASDEVPKTPTGIIVSLADKMDTLAGCFGVGLAPTGTADPYGLRRAALGILRTVLEHGLVFSLDRFIRTAVNATDSTLKVPPAEVIDALHEFFSGRLKAFLQTQSDAPVDVIDAVVSTGIDDLPATVAKIQALWAMRKNADFEPLAVAFKRVANMLKLKGRSPGMSVEEALFAEPAERDLWGAFKRTRQAVEDAVGQRDFAAAARALIDLKVPVDRFFLDVLVVAEDEALRDNRLAMLANLRWLFERVGDISRVHVSGVG